jgi:peroxin-14
MSQRIQFLEAKGLTGPEIDVAVKQASSLNQTAPQTHLAPYMPVYSDPPYPVAPRHSWDWRDYFVRIGNSICGFALTTCICRLQVL